MCQHGPIAVQSESALQHRRMQFFHNTEGFLLPNQQND
jgi:hypothetical protein